MSIGVARLRRGLGALVALAAAGAAVGFFISRSQSLPAGPRPVVWNRTPCAECRMAVSERGFAAQLQLRDGRVLDFDDPGCLFLLLDREPLPVHAIYFHHVRHERWLSDAEAGFVPAGPSPMAFGLGAVERAVEGGIPFAQARAQVLEGRKGGGHVCR